jgi:hypothetical protein
MDRPIHSATSCQCGIGGIPDGFRLLLCDISLGDFQSRLMNGHLHHDLFYQKRLISSIQKVMFQQGKCEAPRLSHP